MKNALLFIPEMYSIKDTLGLGLKKSGIKLHVVDYRKILRQNVFIAKANTLLMWGRDKFPAVQKKANDYYIEEYNRLQPDIIFIYNDEAVLPSTINYFKQKSKVIVLLGDNPLNLNPPNIYNIDILFLADLVVVADSTWKEQLVRIGLNNTVYDYVAYNPELFSDNGKETLYKRTKDLLFVGRSYNGAWGYKRCLFLNQFTDLDIDIYGTGAHWSKWFDLFPKIKDKMVHYSPVKIPFADLKNLMHTYKAFPIDTNPGIVSGMHLRVFECISAGILPLIEYTTDIDYVFNEVSLPVIKNFNDSKKIANEFLIDDGKREKILSDAKKFLNDNYSPEIVMKRILSKC